VPGGEPTSLPTTAFTAGPSVMGLTTFERGGVERQRPLAYVHPHGSSLEWIT
jgi:hypothetical protein